MRGRLTEEGKAKVLNYSEVEEGVDLVFQEIVPYLKHVSMHVYESMHVKICFIHCVISEIIK